MYFVDSSGATRADVVFYPRRGAAHPANLFAEVQKLNGHFGVDRNQAGKAARYGEKVMLFAIAWLQDAIETSLGVLQS